MNKSRRSPNHDFIVRCFAVRSEGSTWIKYTCGLCEWEWWGTFIASRTALEARLALHLVLDHVDLGELVMVLR